MLVLVVVVSNSFFIMRAQSYHVTMLPFYYPILHETEISYNKKISRRFIGNEPLVMYLSVNQTSTTRTSLPFLNRKRFVIQSDVCPHMGGHLHKGWLSMNGGIHCPYHGFEFNEEGMFCNIPNPIQKYKRHQSSVCLDTYPIYHRHGYLFIPPSVRTPAYRPGMMVPSITGRKKNMSMSSSSGNLEEYRLDVPFRPYFPPEANNPKFRMTCGAQVIHQYQDIITENLLDMLHISYVHSFGSRLTPIPFDVSFQRIHDWGFRTKFLYCPNQGTISTNIGKVTTVIVENEFYMPSTTITRVIAGDVVKTIHTFTTPHEGKSSTLYWRIYRNFWTDPNIPFFDQLGDSLITILMKRTIQEDCDILSKIYEERRNAAFITKYDISIRKYREMIKKFQNVAER